MPAPMAIAVEEGHRQVVDALLDAGANVNTKRRQGVEVIFSCPYFELYSPFGASPLRIAEHFAEPPFAHGEREVLALLQNPGTGAR